MDYERAVVVEAEVNRTRKTTLRVTGEVRPKKDLTGPTLLEMSEKRSVYQARGLLPSRP